MKKKKTPIGSRLVKLRLSNGLTQNETANQLGANRITYSGWERDISEPPICFLIKLAKLYGITIDNLIDGKL